MTEQTKAILAAMTILLYLIGGIGFVEGLEKLSKKRPEPLRPTAFMLVSAGLTWPFCLTYLTVRALTVKVGSSDAEEAR